MRNVVFTVLFDAIIYDFLSSDKAEVNVEVRHGNTLFAQKSFKKELIFEGVDVGDAYAVRHDRTAAAASAGAYRDTHLLRRVHIVPHDKEVAVESALVDDAQLVFQTFCDFVVYVAVFSLYALVGKVAQILSFVAIPHLFVGVFRDDGRMLCDKIVAVNLVGNLSRRRNRFGTPAEKFRHFVPRFEIELVGVESCAVYLALFATESDAHHRVLNVGVLFFDVVHVVCGNHFYADFSCDLAKRIHYDFIFGKMMILKLDIKIARFENISHFDCRRLCLFVFALQKKMWHFAGKARRQTYKPFAMLSYMLQIDTRFHIKTVHKSK